MRRRLSLVAALSLAIIHVASALEVDVGYNPEDIFQPKQDPKDKFDEPYTFTHDSSIALSHGYDAPFADTTVAAQSTHAYGPMALNRSPPPAPFSAYSQPAMQFAAQLPNGPIAALVPGNIPVPQLVSTLERMMGYNAPTAYYASSPAPYYSSSPAAYYA
ncbi:hypothetical protein H4R19_005572, partial [Coemansia spiralis]